MTSLGCPKGEDCRLVFSLSFSETSVGDSSSRGLGRRGCLEARSGAGKETTLEGEDVGWCWDFFFFLDGEGSVLIQQREGGDVQGSALEDRSLHSPAVGPIHVSFALTCNPRATAPRAPLVWLV